MTTATKPSASSSGLQRYTEVLPVTITASLVNGVPSASVDYSSSGGGEVYLTTGSATSLNWYTSPDGTNWYIKIDDSGNPVTSIIASGDSCKIPDALFGAKFIGCTCQVAGGSNTAQISLKG